MPTKGYDDSDNIAKIRRLLSGNAERSRRSAIIEVAGERNVRRIEMKMSRASREEGQSEENSTAGAMRARIAAKHADLFPAALFEGEGRISFVATAPDPGPEFWPDGRTPYDDPKTRWVLTVCVSVDAAGVTGRAQVLPVGKNEKPRLHVMTGHHAAEAMRACGLAHETRNGLLQAFAGVGDIVRRNAEHLAEAWQVTLEVGADINAGDLLNLAIEHERRRLADVGLDRIGTVIPNAARALAGAVIDSGTAINRYLASCFASPVKLSMVSDLTAFLHGAVLAADLPTIESYDGRPVDLLHTHLSDWVTPGFDVQPHAEEVAWLHGIFGAKPLAPVSSSVLERALVHRYQIDECRAASAADASALARMLVSAEDRYYGGGYRHELGKQKNLGFVLDRLNSGPECLKPYAAMAVEFSKIARTLDFTPPFFTSADVAGYTQPEKPRDPEDAWLALMHEVIVQGRRSVLMAVDDLIVPTLAHLLRTGGDADAFRTSLILAKHEPERERLTALAMDMVWGGRTLAQFASALVALSPWRPSWSYGSDGPCLLTAMPWEKPWYFYPENRDSEDPNAIETAWKEWSPFLTPCWRLEGQKRFASAVAGVLERSSRSRGPKIATVWDRVRANLGLAHEVS